MMTKLIYRLKQGKTWAGITAALTATTAAVAALSPPQGLVIGLTLGIAGSGVIGALLHPSGKDEA